MSTKSPLPRWLPWLALAIALNAVWSWTESLAVPATGAQRATGIGLMLVVVIPSVGVFLSRNRRATEILLAVLSVGLLASIALRQ